MQHQSRRLTNAGRRRDALSRRIWHGTRWSSGFVVVVCVGAWVWAVLFILQREMDINILVA
jgi:hypothetical protein